MKVPPFTNLKNSEESVHEVQEDLPVELQNALIDNTDLPTASKNKENLTSNKRASPKCSTNEEPIPKTPKLCQVANFNLRELLNKHPLGPRIISTANKKILDTQCQSHLCDIIVIHFLQFHNV